jgi:hypothetical protein
MAIHQANKHVAAAVRQMNYKQLDAGLRMQAAAQSLQLRTSRCSHDISRRSRVRSVTNHLSHRCIPYEAKLLFLHVNTPKHKKKHLDFTYQLSFDSGLCYFVHYFAHRLIDLKGI